MSPGEGLLSPSLHRHTFSHKGVAVLSFTGRIGRAQFHRARSASKKDGLAAPLSSFQARSFTSPEGDLIGLLLRTSNEGHPIPPTVV